MSDHFDFLGRKLELDDHVIMIEGHYKSYRLAKIIKFTEKMVRVKWGSSEYQEGLQYSKQLVRVDGPEVTLYYLKNSK